MSEPIDWQSVWKQLDWDDETRQQEAIKERLRQRARQYAAALPEQDAQAGSLRSVLIFKLGDERYGIDAVLVRMVRPVENITPVPGAPRFYRGVVNIRGQIITVMDLRLFFNMEFDPRDTPGELVVIQANGLEIGLLAHHVRDVIAVSEEHIQALDDVRYARGMTSGQVILLDIARLFEDERLIVGGVDEL